jgi:hypothetical protein
MFGIGLIVGMFVGGMVVLLAWVLCGASGEQSRREEERQWMNGSSDPWWSE